MRCRKKNTSSSVKEEINWKNKLEEISLKKTGDKLEENMTNMKEGRDGLISIIVPMYRAAEYIEETIACVEKQTYTDWELILVDDCGPDESLPVAARCRENSANREKIRIVRNERNLGAAETRNHGVAEARGRYIAYLDADDLWLPTKLEEELLFLRQKDAAFVFTSYEFGDANAKGTGRMVHVPQKLDFCHALSRTVIFTSTVMFDTWKLDKSLIHMPDMASEDTALWWSILKTGITAYGMDRALTIYRRPAQSLSSNKGKAVQRLWNLLLEVAGCSRFTAVFYLIGWAFHATMRRVWFRKISGKVDSWNRAMVLFSGLLEILMASLLYLYFWFWVYYPILQQPRISQDGYNFGNGLKLYSKGHVLVIGIYVLLLYVFLHALQGNKVGEHKPASNFLSQTFAMILVNLITYFQLGLMRNWLVPVMPMLALTALQIGGSLLVSYLTYSIYRGLFAAKELVLVSGTQDVDEILARFSRRSDMYYICRAVNTVDRSAEEIEEIVADFDNCLLWNLKGKAKERIVRFCYAHGIKVYVLPDIDDVLVRGTQRLHQFSTSIYLLNDVPLELELRVFKRAIDILLSVFFLIVLSPVLLVSAVIVGKSHGSLFHTSVRITRNGKQFKMLKLRTVDHVAEDGSLIYIPGGRFLRETHLDELPQLVNILRGDMSFIGPRPDREEVYEERCGKNPLYACRTKVRAGMIGYAQVYGKYNSSEEERLNLDLEYIQNYSLWQDIQLFFLGLKFIVKADGEEE